MKASWKWLWTVTLTGVLTAGCGGASSDDDDDEDDAPADTGVDGPADAEGARAGECSDGADNDRDGLFDCDDPDCAGAPECDDYEGDDSGECSDGLDNDRDGATDCDDAGCAGSPDCAPTDAYEGDADGECADGLDNDGDGLTDCADDGCDCRDAYVLFPGGSSRAEASVQCAVLGGHLAAVFSEAENDFAADLCAAHTTDFGCLLGLERPFTVWDSGETVSYVPGVFSTHDGQPHAYILSNGSGDWEDGDQGGSPNPFLCRLVVAAAPEGALGWLPL